jgi:hypothetical protein
MYYFALDSSSRIRYSMTTPRGGSWKIFENLAFSRQQSAVSQTEAPARCDPLPTGQQKRENKAEN